MRELVFALEFRGHAGAVKGAPHLRHARTIAPSQELRTVLTDAGIETRMKSVSGDRAELDSRVTRFPDGSFVEEGTITYGRAGTVTFVTMGRGVVGPSPRPGWTCGAVIWEITGGSGPFAGARGLVTSSFAVSPGGEVIDHHIARIYTE